MIRLILDLFLQNFLKLEFAPFTNESLAYYFIPEKLFGKLKIIRLILWFVDIILILEKIYLSQYRT